MEPTDEGTSITGRPAYAEMYPQYPHWSRRWDWVLWLAFAIPIAALVVLTLLRAPHGVPRPPAPATPAAPTHR